MVAIRLIVVALVAGFMGLGGVRAEEKKADNAKLLVGKWEVSKADEGTVPPGTLIEFTKDGKMKLSAKKGTESFDLEGTYKVEKDTFTFALKLGEESKEQTITITKINDTELHTKNKDGKVVEFKKTK